MKNKKIKMEDMDIIICGSTSYFKDDVQTTCDYCGNKIIHRPYMPYNVRKMCLDCVEKGKLNGVNKK